MAIRSLSEARAECTRAKLGPSACMDLVEPFCGPGENVAVDLDVDGGLAFCKREESLSPAQARVLLGEAEARARAAEGPPWLLIGGGVLLAGVVAWLAVAIPSRSAHR